MATSLAGLKTGSGWICSGEAGIFELKHFPRISTYDNSATPTKDAARREIKTAPVDQERLRTIIGDAVKEAEGNDPAKLRAEISRLNTIVQRAARPVSAVPSVEEESKRAQFVDLQGKYAIAAERCLKWEEIVRELHAKLAALTENVAGRLESVSSEASIAPVESPRSTHVPGKGIPPSVLKMMATTKPLKVTSASDSSAAVDIPGPGRKILNSLSTWAAMGHIAPSNAQVAWLAGYSPSSTSYTNPRGALRSGGFIDYPAPDRLALTIHGAACAVASVIDADLLAHVVALLPGPEGRILASIAKAFPHQLSNRGGRGGRVVFGGVDELHESARRAQNQGTHYLPSARLRPRRRLAFLLNFALG